MQTMDRKTGLTLVEVLVVVALFAVMLSIIIPATTGSMVSPKGTQVMANGRSIHLAIFSTITDIGADGRNFFASADAEEYATSTEYFAWLMKDLEEGGPDVLAQDFKLFSNRPVDSARELSDFSADHNIWSVVAGHTYEFDPEDPFLISRNLNEPRLIDWGANEKRKLENVGKGTYLEPFGEEILLVIRLGGGGEILKSRQFRWSVLNPNRLENPILEP